MTEVIARGANSGKLPAPAPKSRSEDYNTDKIIKLDHSTKGSHSQPYRYETASKNAVAGSAPENGSLQPEFDKPFSGGKISKLM